MAVVLKKPETSPEAPARSSMRVRALKLGFYPDPGAIRARARQPGEEFVISKLEHFAGPKAGNFQWMEWADEPTTQVPAAEPTSIMSIPARLQQDPLRPGARIDPLSPKALENL